MNEQLYRSRTDVVWTGVAGGVAQRLDWDSSLVRVGWALLVPLTGGLALLAYVVMWMVVPLEPAPAPDPARPAEGTAGATDAPPREPLAPPSIPSAISERPPGERGGLVLGALLIAAGAFFLLREMIPDIDWGRIWPMILVAVGVALLLTALRARR